MTKLKNTKGKTISSARWLARQLNDVYTKKSKAEGYPSRAAYKLIDIEEKFKIIKKYPMNIVDLGSAPGGWSTVLSKRAATSSNIFAVDILDMRPIPRVTFIKGDFLRNEIQKILKEKTDSQADLILSDIASNTSGHKSIDHIRSCNISRNVITFSTVLLKTGGTLVLKLFRGNEEKQLISNMTEYFQKINLFKPKSSRNISSEIFIIGSNFLNHPQQSNE